MEQNVKVTCQAFQKNADGSWITNRVSDIETGFGLIRLPTGMMFKKERTFQGLNVVALLEKNCVK